MCEPTTGTGREINVSHLDLLLTGGGEGQLLAARRGRGQDIVDKTLAGS